MERYHRLLRRAYEIVTKKYLKLFDANRFQMAVKAINNTVESNRLIPTLLVFGAYLRMTELNFSNPIVEYRATTIKKAIKEVRKLQAFKKINNMLHIRNSLSIIHVHDLYLNNLILYIKRRKDERDFTNS